MEVLALTFIHCAFYGSIYQSIYPFVRPIHRKRAVSGNRNRERPHYSDDGYTSDPGLLREVIRLEQVEVSGCGQIR